MLLPLRVAVTATAEYGVACTVIVVVTVRSPLMMAETLNME